MERFQQAWREALLPRVFAARPLDAAGHQALLALVLPSAAVLAFGLGRLRRYPVT